MPIYIDRPDIPGPLRRLLTSSKYSDDLDEHFDELPQRVRDLYRENNLSATTLVASPRQRVLYKRHHMKVLLDPVAEGMRKFLGNAVHAMLEQDPDPGDIPEVREGYSFGAHNRPGLLRGLRKNGNPIRTMYIHGKPDVFNPQKELVTDWKVTSAISMIYGRKMDHEAQLNILALILNMNGKPVHRLTNEYLFFDWSSYDFGKLQSKGYPVEARKTVEVPIWSDSEVEEFVNVRLRTHLEADTLPDEEIPHCTKQGPMGIDELWMSDSEFKVHKVDYNKKTNERKVQKNAKHTAHSMEEAVAWTKDPVNEVDAKGLVEYTIKERPAEAKRCAWCTIHDFCDQYRAMRPVHAEANSEVPEV